MRFIDKDVVLAIHDEQLACYGGLPGVRDMGLLESALARAENKFAYGETEPYALAASLSFGITRNHPFSDANKRTALHAGLLFLAVNQVPVPPPSVDMVLTTVALAEGSLSEDDFAAWLRQSAAAAP